MSVRDVIGGTLVVAVLVLLSVVGWQTAVNRNEIGKLTEIVKSIADEGAKGWATKKDVESRSGAVV